MSDFGIFNSECKLERSEKIDGPIISIEPDKFNWLNLVQPEKAEDTPIDLTESEIIKLPENPLKPENAEESMNITEFGISKEL